MSLFSFNGKRIQPKHTQRPQHTQRPTRARHFLRRNFRQRTPSAVAVMLIIAFTLSAAGFALPGTDEDAPRDPTAQEAVHIIAESFRSAGAPEDHVGITTCQSIWHDLQDAKNSKDAETPKQIPAPEPEPEQAPAEPVMALLSYRTVHAVSRQSIRTIALYDRENDEFHIVELGKGAPKESEDPLEIPDCTAYAGTPFPSEVEFLYHTPAQDQVHYAAEVARWMLGNNDENVDEQALASIIEYASDYWYTEEEAFQLHVRLYSGILTDAYDEATEQDAIRLAKITFCEARGIKSIAELASIMWGTLNRVDNPEFPNSIQGVIDSGHVAYYSGAPTVSDYGVDLVALARDVIYRWQLEKQGAEDVGRVLPADYFYWSGSNGHNWFRQTFEDYSHPWDYSLPDPYV